VAIRENEAVAVRPLRIFWIVFEKLGPENVRDGCHSHRHARMSRVRSFDSVNRKKANGIDRAFGKAGLLILFCDG
jgi:hypothetical protein